MQRQAKSLTGQFWTCFAYQHMVLYFLDSNITDFKKKAKIFDSFAEQWSLIEKSIKVSLIFFKKAEIDDLFNID